MRSKYLLAGAGIAIVLTAGAVIGVVQELWWLVTAAGMLLLSATLLVALDADRRLRSLRALVRRELGRTAGQHGKIAKPVAQAPAVAEVDVIGAVRVLQAQYTGRLDRMQQSIDEAVAGVRAGGEGSTNPVGRGEQA